MALIDYKGIQQNSSIEKPLTDEEFLSLSVDYYRKPDIELVKRKLKTIANGGTRMNHVYDYFIKEVMSKSIGTRASWSIYDGLHNRQIMEYFNGKVDKNKKVFPDTMSLIEKIETAFRICGIRYCVKLPNYPLKSVYAILDKYNVNGNWYDFSCGWASRLLGALSRNINYFGTDPNHELTPKLIEISNLYKQVNGGCDSIVDIRTQGSQTLVDEWKGKIGLAFSSPPYFNLEDYQIGDDQSYKTGMSYSMWVDSYLKPTIHNIWEYLTNDGNFVINVKSFREYSTNVVYDIEGDVKNISESIGFRLTETLNLNNIKRCHGDISGKDVSFNKNDEKIFVFRKTS